MKRKKRFLTYSMRVLLPWYESQSDTTEKLLLWTLMQNYLTKYYETQYYIKKIIHNDKSEIYHRNVGIVQHTKIDQHNSLYFTYLYSNLYYFLPSNSFGLICSSVCSFVSGTAYWFEIFKNIIFLLALNFSP